LTPAKNRFERIGFQLLRRDCEKRGNYLWVIARGKRLSFVPLYSLLAFVKDYLQLIVFWDEIWGVFGVKFPEDKLFSVGKLLL
jgi:hypothetical protein